MPGNTPQPEKVVFETPTRGAGPAVLQHAVTRDPDLADGPYRTLRHYYEYPAQKKMTGIKAVARARGVTPRTIIKHRRALVELGYLSIKDEGGVTTLVLKDLTRIPRLKRLAEALTDETQTDVPPARTTPRANDAEAALLQKLKQLHPDFHTRGALKLLRGYQGDTPVEALLDEWLAAARSGHIPKAWGVGLYYREIEAGNPPPRPAAPPLSADPDLAGVFAAGQAISQALEAENGAVAQEASPSSPSSAPATDERAEQIWRAALDTLRETLKPAAFSVMDGSTGLTFTDGVLVVQGKYELLTGTYLYSMALQAVRQALLEADDATREVGLSFVTRLL